MIDISGSLSFSMETALTLVAIVGAVLLLLSIFLM
jgi:hypothetical protein